MSTCNAHNIAESALQHLSAILACSKEWACGKTIPIPFDEQFPRAPIDERCRNAGLHKHENSTLENADLVESKSLNAYTDVLTILLKSRLAHQNKMI